MPGKIDKCCADCGHLTKRNYCKRYNIFMLGANMEQCTCECFVPASEISDDVIDLDLAHYHSREGARRAELALMENTAVKKYHTRSKDNAIKRNRISKRV